MKISINKRAKRGLSLVLAFAMLIGCLFTANVGVTIIAGAETAPIEEGTIDLLEFGDYLVNDLGSTSKWYDNKLADNGETGADWDNAIILIALKNLFTSVKHQAMTLLVNITRLLTALQALTLQPTSLM